MQREDPDCPKNNFISCYGWNRWDSDCISQMSAKFWQHLANAWFCVETWVHSQHRKNVAKPKPYIKMEILSHPSWNAHPICSHPTFVVQHTEKRQQLFTFCFRSLSTNLMNFWHFSHLSRRLAHRLGWKFSVKSKKKCVSSTREETLDTIDAMPKGWREH